MSSYTIPIETAFLIFPAIAFVLTLPYMIYNYKKYGAVSPLRSLVLFSFLFYLMCAYFLVILPLPDPMEVAQRTTPIAEWVPFTFVVSFLRDSPFVLSDPSTYLPALKSHAFLEPAFNILLLLPFGAYLSYYFRENLIKTVLATFALSLFFELTQLTGLYGIYPRAYRLFSVDDLLLNTLGGLAGFYLGLAIRHVLPSKKGMDTKAYERSQKVGYLRKLTADLVDMLVLLVLTPLIGQFFQRSEFVFPVLFLLYFVGAQALIKGRSVGKLLVNIKVEHVGEKPPLVLWLLFRYLLVIVPIWAIELLWRPLQGTAGAVWLLAFIGVVFLMYFASWLVGFFKTKRLWYEVFSRTVLRSTFRPKHLVAPPNDSGE